MQNIFDPLIKIYKALYLFAYDITGNYGLALILLSFFTFVVLYPFNKKAQEIQNKEHKIQFVLSPQIDEIKKQYSGREQYEQLQWLYRRYGYHPLFAIRSALGLIFQIPFLTAAYYMLSGLVEIQGVPWGFIPNLGASDHLLGGINVLPFVMTFVTVVYAFVMVEISKKERIQTIGIGSFFLILLYTAPSALLIFWTCNLIWSLLDSVFSKKLERVGDYIAENVLAFHIIFALSVTVGLIVPTEIYIKNASQLWFDYIDILKYFIADTAKYFVILLTVYIICCRKKFRYIYLSILLGLLFGVFLQSYIISIDYGLFDGHEIEWEKYTKAGLINAYIWLFCILESFINFKRFQFDSVKIKNYVKPIAFGIVFIQCAVLLFIIISNPIHKDIVFEDGKASVLTTKNMFTVSEKENIIVFLLDTFDASVFEEIQKNNPEVNDNLKDFTYYPDTTSSFGFTHYSLPEILTGKLYDPSYIYPKYISEAWRGNPYYDMLKKNGFVVNLYTSGNYVYSKAPIDNLVAEKITITNNITNGFKNLVMFRISPHYLKKLYYQYQPSAFNATAINGSLKPYEENDREFFIGLKKGLRQVKENIFHFYHLVGMHYPYILDENAELLKEGQKGTAYKQALGSLKIVNEYINQLKKCDSYENSSIVIIADHGFHNKIGSRPIFLMKYPHNENKELIVSQQQNTVAELMPMLFRQKSFKVKKDIVLESENKHRFYYYESEDKNGHFVKYQINGEASNLDSWIELGEIKRNNSTDRKYNIGDRIDFTVYGNSNKYKTYGWGDKVWTSGSLITNHEAELILHIEPKLNEKNLILKIECNPLLEYFGTELRMPYRDIELAINGLTVGNWSIDDKDSKVLSCRIPQKIMKNEDLIIKFIIKNPSGIVQPERFQIMEIQILEDN